MRGLTIVGVILLTISGVLFYLTTDFLVERITISHLMGVMAGIGIGLFAGGIVGYVSKGSAVKRERERERIAKLQNEKYELQQKVKQQDNNNSSI